MLADGDGKVFCDALNQALFLSRHTPYHTDKGPKVRQENETWKYTSMQTIDESVWVYLNKFC